MLSASQSAEILGISSARVRKLASEGALDGVKIGKSWALQETSVYDRLSKKPTAGRPARTTGGTSADKQAPAHDLHSLYLECKQAFQFEPSLQAIEEAKTQEEAGFYMAVADYFLQSKQRELIAQGVY
ncbi:helix-turn-helix domain-containing protein [Slackia piriformis]|uniref:helix-turn-helix domain-containing protein n=1 Tax=Slackia piriformis TaxID=626934 RepID=UPI0026DCA202|nr:helix-turn-helix domain-containing protein [Slackia piriformis]MDO5024097.1 helix-turn-helix domain-containing protein [Slackia piriformis]